MLTNEPSPFRDNGNLSRFASSLNTFALSLNLYICTSLDIAIVNKKKSDRNKKERRKKKSAKTEREFFLHETVEVTDLNEVYF
jgi:hypothetical protein